MAEVGSATPDAAFVRAMAAMIGVDLSDERAAARAYEQATAWQRRLPTALAASLPVTVTGSD